MKKLIAIIAITCLFGLSSCAGYYTHIVTTQGNITKIGEAKKRIWLGLAFNVDLSIATAAKNGGIEKIANVDYYVVPGFLNMLYVTKVTGE